MKQYEKYKDSGVEWLGEIPEHWKQSKLKHEFYIKARVGWKGLKSDEFQQDSYAYLVTGTDFKDVEINWKNCYQIDEFRYNDDPFIQLMNGDLLITKDGTIGKTSFVRNLDKPACLNSGIFVLRQIKDTSVDYFYWILNSSIFHDFNKLTVSGSTIQHLYQNIFENFIFSVPEKVEQQAITLYLNHTTSVIDLLIKEKESLISKLQEKRKVLINEVVTKGLNPNAPMRDSGIEWLGMIPEHWKVTKINRAFNEIGSGTTPTSGSSKYYENGDINWLNTGDLNDGVITKTNKRITSVAKKEFSTLKLYPKGSVVIALYGATIGKLGLLEIDTTTNQACCVLSDSKSITQKYLFYYLYSSREHIISLAYGGGQPNISQELIKQLPILQTSIEEQLEIVNFIESRITKIDATIGEIQLQLQKLKEYKTAVISEVVTGKVDVREWKTPNQT